MVCRTGDEKVMKYEVLAYIWHIIQKFIFERKLPLLYELKSVGWPKHTNKYVCGKVMSFGEPTDSEIYMWYWEWNMEYNLKHAHKSLKLV